MKHFWVLTFVWLMPAVGLYGDVFTVSLLDQESGQFTFTVERYQGEFASVRGRFSESEQKIFCEKYGSVTHFSVTDEEVMFAIDKRFFTIGSDRRVVLWSPGDDDAFFVGVLAGTSLRKGIPFWICFEHVKSGKVYVNARENPSEVGFEYRNPYAEICDFGATDFKSVAGASVRKKPWIREKRKGAEKANDFGNDDPWFFARGK